MANSTITDLTTASALTGTELIYGDDGVNDVKITADQIKTFVTKSPVTVGDNVSISTSTLQIGNSTANLVANSIIVKVANSTSSANLQPTQLKIGTTTVNGTIINAAAINITGQTNTATLYVTTSVNVGTQFIANTLGAYSTGLMNAVSYKATGLVANSLGVYTGIINAATHSVGALFTANATLVNTAALNVTGQVNTATLYVTTSANVGTAFIANTLGAYSTGIINGTSHTVGASLVANSLGLYTGIVNAATHSVGALFTANATLINAAAINITGQTNTATLYVTTSVNVGTQFIANTLGAYSTGIVNGSSHSVGALFTANATLVNAAAINITGQTNTATLYVTTSVNVGTQFIANTLGAYSTGIVNGASHTTTGITANATGIWPTSNSSGQTLGGATQRWVITANSITTSGNITTPNTGLVTATSAVANGYTYLTGGILMQWGWVLANSSVGNITFPVAFPSAMYHISCTMSNTTVSTGNAAYQCIASNSSTANVRSANVGNPGANVMYIAIGS